MSKKLLLAILALFIVSSTFATTNGYFGASYLRAEYSEDDLDDIDLDGLRIFEGKPVNEYLVFEGMLIYATGDDSGSDGGVDYDVDLDVWAFSLFGKGTLPLGEYVKLYALLGGTYAYLDADIKFLGTKSSESDDKFSLSYGGGIEVKIGESLAAHADYIMYIDRSDYDIGGFAIGLTYRF